MGKAKKTRKVSVAKKMMNPNDTRLVKKTVGMEKQAKLRDNKNKVKEIPKISSAMFFQANNNLKPPYQVLVDTNFFNFSIQNKLDPMQALMDCLLAKAVPCVTDCVIAEMEKLGHRYRLALRLAKDPRFTRLTCDHSGTYADDCLVTRVEQHRCYIVATNDRDLRRRLRKIPGVPIIRVQRGKYAVERMPESISAVPLNKSIIASKKKKKSKK
ncbi:rRNA-processing protein fcf1 [Perkinsus olseni]|uniref:rRNA-processing protein fcf1 n=2 Tax=Perkinsus olseni TaxID=32597 RepID=A0A7J6NLI3_PEROL|nr:rRNA-processing protein fcf1 [Perkinsus olseni]